MDKLDKAREVMLEAFEPAAMDVSDAARSHMVSEEFMIAVAGFLKDTFTHALDRLKRLSWDLDEDILHEPEFVDPRIASVVDMLRQAAARERKARRTHEADCTATSSS